MQGLEILNKTVITKTPDWAFIFVVGSIILLIVFFVILVNVDSIVLQTLSAVLLIMTLIADLSLIFYEVPTNRYRYEVTIDESVTITEIYDNYDVIEQRGDIWILEDKEKK